MKKEYINENWTEDRPYCVYKHTSPSGKVYIGQTIQRNLNERWRGGNGYPNTIFEKAIIKYGWDNITHEIIASCLTKEEANIIEIELIAYYKNIRMSYNSDNGGAGIGHTMKTPEDVKQKISNSLKGRFVGENNPSYGRTWIKGYKRIYKENMMKIVPPDELQGYLDNGWRHGLPPQVIEKTAQKIRGRKNTPESNAKRSATLKGKHPCSDDARKKISESNSNRIYIHKECVEKFIKPDELQEYLDDGWVLGRYLRPESKASRRLKLKGRKFIHKDGRQIMVQTDELQEYLDDGWTLGRLF